MKKILPYILILFIFFSCKKDRYFDQVPPDVLSYDKIFESKSGVEKMLATVYSYVPDDYTQRYANYVYDGFMWKTNTTGPWVAGSSEAKQVWGFSYSNKMVTNTMAPSDYLVETMWAHFYEGINFANIFMSKVKQAKGVEEPMTSRYYNEARALRAMYYFYLLRVFGPVPIIGDQPSETTTMPVLQRAPVDTLVDYIVSELDAVLASNALWQKAESAEAGHIDNAIVIVYKLQTLLFAASPLFNGSVSYFSNLTNPDGKKLFPQGASVEQKRLKWAKAAAAAKTFLEKFENSFSLTRKTTNGVFDPYLSYREAVRGTDGDTEGIFYRINNLAWVMQYERTPFHAGAPDGYRASGGVGPSQYMVDAYAMANGKFPIAGYNSPTSPVVNAESGYTESGFSTTDYKDPITGRVLAPAGTFNAWVAREPRFYADITFSNQIWLNTAQGQFKSNFEYNGNSGMAPNRNDYAPTGYVVRKSAPLGDWGGGGRSLIIYRLAQMYLDYAEALNESDPSNANILKYVNEVRKRAGVPEYGSGLPTPAGQASMRDAIRKERQIELSFESVRYFDVRRWGIAEQTENQPLVGMNLQKSGAEFYQRTVLESRVFQPRFYFFPLPQKDINIDLGYEKKLVQNPGW